MRTANSEKLVPHKFCSFTSSYSNVHALLVQHLYSVFFSIYGLAWSNIRISFDAEKAENLMKMYRKFD